MPTADRNRLRVEIANEIRSKAPEDEDVKRQALEFAEHVRDDVKIAAIEAFAGHEMEGKGGYHTGAFIESIQVKRIKRWWRKTMPNYQVYSTMPELANWLEEGTDIDKPGSKSPWGPNTPTPAYHPFSIAAFRNGGTADGEGGDIIEEE